MKTCSRCGIEKDEIQFGKYKNSPDGLKPACKKCLSNVGKDYYNKNKLKEKLRKKNQYNKNKDLILLKCKEYRDSNKIKIKEYYKNYRLLNPEKEKIQKENYRKNNKDLIDSKRKAYIKKNKIRINQYYSNYRNNKKETDSNYKLKSLLRINFIGKLKRNLVKKGQSFFKYTGLSYESYIDYFNENFPEEMKTFTEKNKWHVDHIIPCKVYDFNNPDDIKKCYNPKNLRLILADENLKKSDNIDYSLIREYNIFNLLPENIYHADILKPNKKDCDFLISCFNEL